MSILDLWSEAFSVIEINLRLTWNYFSKLCTWISHEQNVSIFLFFFPRWNRFLAVSVGSKYFLPFLKEYKFSLPSRPMNEGLEGGFHFSWWLLFFYPSHATRNTASAVLLVTFMSTWLQLWKKLFKEYYFPCLLPLIHLIYDYWNLTNAKP
jgi:hypothetical protein